MPTMHAGQIIAPRKIEIVAVPMPEPSEGQIRVRPTIGCLCGSDLPFFFGDGANPMVRGTIPPLMPGLSLHELIGVVDASRCAQFREGDRVLALPYEHQGLAEAFLSEPAAAVPLPKEFQGDHVVLAQPLGTIFHALNKLGRLINLNVVVIGQGPIGLLFSALLPRLGVRRLIALELLPERREAARQMGATHVVNPAEVDAAAAVMVLTEGVGADLVVEAVGEPETLILGIDLLRRGGTLLAFGVPHKERYDLPFSNLFLNEVRIVTSVGPNVAVDFPIAVDMIAQGRLDVTPLVTHRFPFHRAQEAYDTFADRRDGAIKVLLQFQPGDA
jgi:2-desacetyl-2-hydroxyethyl bacteriochlorophyllide A dehydrogenase